jgi:hypothetical protein
VFSSKLCHAQTPGHDARHAPRHTPLAVTPTPFEISEAADFDGLRDVAPELFAGDADDLFCSASWFETLRAHGFAPDARLRIAVAHDTASGALLAMPMVEAQGLAAFANYYSCLYAPITTKPACAPELVLALLTHLRNRQPRPPTLRFAPLDAQGWFSLALRPALARAGYIADHYFCFGNWYLRVDGQSYEQYFAALPPTLRNTVKRRERRLARTGDWSVSIVATGEPALEAAIADFQTVYVNSWKAAEPYPRFIPELCRMAARQGWLRLGVLRLDARPIAAQLWLHNGGKSMIYKLAYDQSLKRLSPGTLLTAAMMRHALDTDRATEVDYLSGDDAYKSEWMSHRRERIGVVGFDPRSPRGLAAAARHFLDKAWRKLSTPRLPDSGTQAGAADGNFG